MARAAREAARPIRTATPPDGWVPQRRRFHIPTSAGITIGVAILTVLILPAVTRQWDDRQKARELQASLVESVTSATSQVQGETLALAHSSVTIPETGRLIWWDIPQRQEIFNRWEVARLKVETQMRLYYGAEGTSAWGAYGRAIAAFANLAALEARIPNNETWEPGRIILDDLIRRILVRPNAVNEFIWDLDHQYDEERRTWQLERLAGALARRAFMVIDLITSNRPQGFSTTRGDLIRDILPGI